MKAKDIALPAAADEHPFSLVKGGYSVGEVAAFVATMSADMTGLTPQDLRRASFSVERRGYDKAEVYAYLNRVAAEIEAELDLAREQARHERILANDPTLAAPPATVTAEPAEPEPEPDPQQPDLIIPTRSTIPVRPPVEIPPVDEAPATPEPSPVESGLAPGAEVIYFTAPSESDEPHVDAGSMPGREILWLTEDEIAAAAQTPELVAEPAPIVRPEPPVTPPTSPEPVVTAPPTAEPVGEIAPEPGPTVAEASSEIGELLRAAHDMAVRLRANAEADVKATVETARVEIEERTRSQHRELDDAKAAAQRRHAEIVHGARLSAGETRAAAELDAARTRAAADAVLAQAKAEVEAVQALARHNLLELEMARDQAIADATEMLGLGKSMLLSVTDLDRDLAARLVHTRSVIGSARQALSSETS
ncbi:MAG: DivIVA domain-containing protein [Actinomycetota bacterium]